MSDGPWSFDEALTRCQKSSMRQEVQEENVRQAFAAFAQAERAYDIAVARKILGLKAEGMAITACERVAKGDPEVARLRHERGIAEGGVEAAKHAAWRRNADRKDAQEFSGWSQRRELAEFHGEAPPSQDGPIFGGARV